MNWELHRVHLVLLYFLTYSVFVNIYKPLFHHLTTVADLASQWVTAQVIRLFILWRCSLEMATALLLILGKKLWAEMLANKALWQSLAAARVFCLHLLTILLHYGRRCAVQLLGHLKQVVWATLSSSAQWVHHHLAACFWENSRDCKTVLRGGMRQASISVFFGFLDGVLEVFHMSALAVRYRITHIFSYARSAWDPASEDNSLVTITSVLPPARVPLSHRFKGPTASVLKDFPSSTDMLQFVVVSENIGRGAGRYHLEGTALPLHVRFQSYMRMREPFSVQSRSTTVRQLKIACIVFIVLYLSILSVIVQ
ncbi:unnamed protein product [Caretta caretta]